MSEQALRKKQKQARSRDFDEYLIKALKDDPELASEYLNAAFEDGDTRVFLVALGHLAKARGISAISKKTGLNRENIYRIVSDRGNPRIKSITALLSAIGLQLRTEPLPKRVRRPA